MANDKDFLVKNGLIVGGNLTVNGTAPTTFSANTSYGDNVHILLGDSNDLLLLHDGNNSYIRDTGTGYLNISGDDVRILNAAQNEVKAEFKTNGAVDLYYDNALKLATASDGVDITGTLDVSSHLVVGGNLTVNGTTTTINSTTLTVDDLNIVLASGAADSSAADGAGITIDGASASLIYDHTGTQWEFNKTLSATNIVMGGGTGSNLGGNDITNVGKVTFGSADANSTSYGRLYHSSNILRVQSGSSGTTFLDSSGNADVTIDSSGHVFVTNKSVFYGGASTGYNGASFGSASAGATVEIYKPNQTTSGLMIANEQGKAHTWFNYTTGANYITADASDSDGTTYIRSFDGTNYNTHVSFDSSSRVGIGITSPGDYHSNANNLVVRENGHSGITISSGTSNQGSLYFADGTSGDAAYRGSVTYSHSVDRLNFGTAGVNRMHIASGGYVGIGTTDPRAKLHIYANGSLPATAAETSSGAYGMTISGVDAHIDLLSYDDDSTVASSYALGRYNNSTGALIDKWGFVAWYDTGSTGSNLSDRLALHYGTNANSWGNSEILSITREFKVGIRTTSPSYSLEVTGDAAIRQGSLTLTVGADTNAITVTNSTQKVGRIAAPHYTNAEEPMAMVMGSSGSGYNDLYIGGGSSLMNTATALRFYTAANSTTVSGSEIMRITSAGFVGIGTTSPGSKAEIVYGTGGSTQIQLQLRNHGTSDNTGTSLRFTNSTTSGSIYGAAEITALRRLNSNGATDLLFETSTGGTLYERMRIDSSGNVGIGTTSPNVALEVHDSLGTTLDDGVLRLIDDTSYAQNVGAAIALGFKYNSSGNILQRGGVIKAIKENATDGNYASALLFATTQNASSSAERMRIDSSGNVGIGTSSPQDALDLGNASGGKGIAWGGPTGVGHYSTIWSEYGTASIVIGAGLKGSTTNTDFIYPYTGTYGYAAIELDSFSDDGIKFYTAPDGSRTKDAVATKLERMRIDTSGNVGIGDTSPASPLSIHNSSTPRIEVGYSDTQNHYLAWDSAKLHFRADPQNLNASSAILFSVDGSERMRITDSGYVGIGTTSPSAPLEINVNSAVNQLLLTYGSSDHMGLLAGTQGGGIIVEDNNFFAIWHQDYANRGTETSITERFRITSSGYVGIGTNNPTDFVDIRGNVSIINGSPELHFGTTGTSHRNWRVAVQEVVDQGFEIASGTTSAGTSASGDTYTTRFVIKGDDGDVGIGTNAPTVALQIARSGSDAECMVESYHATPGSYNTSTFRLESKSASSSTYDYSFAASGSTANITRESVNHITLAGGQTVFNEDGANLDLRVEGDTDTNLLFIDAGNDRVGIGTSTPGYKFSINTSNNAKILLSGSSDPYIRFQESTTDKAYIQWNSGGYLKLANQEDGSELRIKDVLVFSQNGTDFSTFSSVFNITGTGSSTGWINLGTFTCSNAGDSILIEIVSNSGYNASDSQDNIAWIRFKTSNGSSSQTSSDGGASAFYGNGRVYTFQENANVPAEVRVVQLNTGNYVFHAQFGTYNGDSFYRVSTSKDNTWTHNGTNNGSTAPTGTYLTLGKRRVWNSEDSSPTFKNDTDNSLIVGRAHVGYMGHSDYAGFSHIDSDATGKYALLQSSAGQTYLNAATGQKINFGINNTYYGEFDTNGMKATVFYDYDNTGYYTNPAGYSSMYTIGIGGGATDGPVRLGAGNGKGYRFWDSDNYKIWMSDTSDGTWGYRLDSTSDYNMYFRMSAGTNRGFVFMNSTTPVLQIESTGQVRTIAPIYRSGFTTSGGGDGNKALVVQDYSSWIWNTATNWGLFWAGNDNPAYSYFSTSNPNEIAFVGNGSLRASIDLDNGQSYFGTSVRSPIFYDSDDTDYYLHPASTSIFHQLELKGNYHKIQTGLTNNTSTADTSAGVLFMTTSYTDGRYTTRFRKYDNGGGIPLYIDQSGSTANVFTNQARFGTYSGNAYEFEVFGDARFTVSTASPYYSDSNNTAYFLDPASTGTSLVAGGQVIIGKTTADNTTVGTTIYKSDGMSVVRASGSTQVLNRTTTTGEIVTFRYAGTTEGGISVDTSGTTYNTTSDHRLKENIQPIKDGKEKIMAMKPSTFNFIADEKKETKHGFIAQDMKYIVPESITKNEDTGMYGMDYGRITPVIVAALQDALEEINTLKKRIEELESK